MISRNDKKNDSAENGCSILVIIIEKTLKMNFPVTFFKDQGNYFHSYPGIYSVLKDTILELLKLKNLYRHVLYYENQYE